MSTTTTTTAQHAALAALAKAAEGDPHRYFTASGLGVHGATMLALARKGYARTNDTVAARVGMARPSYKVTLTGLAALAKAAR